MAVVQLARSVATDPGVLKDLANEINVRLQKADDHRLSASLKLAEAKEACKKAGIPFKSWVAREIKQIGYIEATRLAKIGAAPDPAKALADMRASSNARKVAFRNATADPDKAEQQAAIAPPARGKDAICARVKDAIIALSGLPPAGEVAGFFRGTDLAMIIDERLTDAIQWLDEFSAAWGDDGEEE